MNESAFLNPTMLLHPEWSRSVLAVGVAVGALLLGAGLRQKKRRRLLLARGERPLLPSLQSDTLLYVALVLLGVALLGPPLGSRTISVLAAGVDVVFVIDVSRSMDARDVPPSRLARAVRGAEELLGRLQPSDRAALAVFAGNGALLTPLTPDRDVIANLLGSLDTDWMEPASSNAPLGILAALPAFEAGSERPRTIFVLSDGEVQRGLAKVAAEAAVAEVRIFAAGIGTELGANVPDGGNVLRDAAGSVVVSRRNMESLEALSGPGGGFAYRADEWGVFDYASAISALRRDAGSAPGDRVERRVPISAAGPLAALAAILLLIEGIPAPWRRRRGVQHALGAVALLALLGAAPPQAGESLDRLEARVRNDPGNARLQIDLGVAHFTRGHSDAAKRAFFAASATTSDPSLAALATYDLGVADLQAGDLEAARDAFFDALALDPDSPASRQARYNLEWTLRALSVQPREDPEDPKQPHASELQIPDPDRENPAEGEQPEASPNPPRLSAMERERWLERIEDDTTQAVRSGLSTRGNPLPVQDGEPAW